MPCFVASLVYYHPTRDGLRYLSLVLFAIGILSDALDGLVARSKGQASQLGTILAPVADKLLILSALISLSTIRALPEWMRIPAWFNLIVISRDAILIFGTLLLFWLTGKLTIRPSVLGKCTIAAQMGVVPAVLLGLPLKMELLTVVAVMTVVSGMDYLRMGVRELS